MKDNEISHAGEPANSPLQSQTSPPDHILVAEDDGFFRRLNTQVLSRSGYKVDAAIDGADAWQALNDDSYDLLITDNSMPRMTGVELLKKLRSARMALPVIMATSVLPQVELARQPWLQPTATLIKPYSGEEMVRAVKKVLREAYSATDDSHELMHREMKINHPAQAEAPTGASSRSPASAPLRILVVDEDSDLRQMYAEALVGPGNHIDTVKDGAAAWEALKTNRYHLMITEHELPHLTGIELVKMCRAARLDVPVVMAAGRLPIHELTRNPSLQLAATLAKPFTIAALLDTVKSVVGEAASPPQQFELRATA
jgi:DNA-binding response OmpR family regulator